MTFDAASGLEHCDECGRVLIWSDFFVVVGPNGLPNPKDERCAACFLGCSRRD